MEATVVSVGKAVLDGVVGYAKSAAAEEVALQLGVEHDVGFIADELEMMQSFLMTADEEPDQNNKVLNTWVKQVKNVAYNVEDSLVDFEVHAEREKPPLLGCIPRNPCDRRRIAMEVKELKAKVEEVSSRNLRYRLIKDGTTGSKPGSTGVEHGDLGGASGFGINEAWRSAMEQDKPKVDLGRLVISDVVDLQVVAVWGTSGDLGKTSEICKVFDDPDVKSKFGCRAWVRLMHPFDPNEFLQSLVRQICMNFSQDKEVSLAQEGKTVGTNVLLKMEKMGKRELVHEYDAQVSSNRYLIVVDGISKIDEWHCIKSYFPDKKNGSRIVVATQVVEIASLCPEQPYQVSELRHLSSDQVLYLFHKKVEKPEMGYAMPISKSAPVITTDPSSSAVTSSEIQEEGVRQPNVADGGNVVYTASTVARKIYRSKTVIPEDIVVGRSTEKQKVIDLVGHPTDSHNAKVISVWGMGGIGKTTLVRSVYRSKQLSGWKRAWATVLRPFNRDTLLRNLVLQLIEGPTGAGEKKNIATMGSVELASELSKVFGKQNCLIVLDDLSSIDEWNSMKDILAKSRRIIATTREKFVAKHCSDDDQNIYSLKGLEDDVALDLFKNKVFKDASSLDLHPSMQDLAKLILKKCDGLPLAISTMGGYLANKPKNTLEWKKLYDSLSAELEVNPELKTINTALMRSYDGLPYHLKACFLYLSIFPEDHIIRRNHVVKRWIAESFAREMHHMTAVQVGNKYFDELLDRSMMLPCEGAHGEIDSCQLHDLIREICVAKAREDNLVFTLEEGCSLGVTQTQGAIRHLVISSNWNRDKDVIQRMLDLSRIRSLTVFGEWRSFFISNKMRFIRVLDLEHTVGLRDHHLYQIMELLHLRYLSLRRCVNILKLPDSLANLRQLQTLDVRNTYIWKLPVTVTSLQKLQCLRASGMASRQDMDIFYRYKTLMEGESWCNRLRHMGHLFWRPRWLEEEEETSPHVVAEGVNRHDICNMCWYLINHKDDVVSVDDQIVWGVVVPTGISKLKALHTLSGVSLAGGKATFQELKELTQLGKLGVTSVTEEHNKRFWQAIAGYSRLQSLSVQSSRWIEIATMDSCFGKTLWPPKCLESLKIRGRLIKLTEWIHRLQSLSKLQLDHTMLSQGDISAIGMLPNLAVLRLMPDSYNGNSLRVQRSSFPSLLVLELMLVTESVEFEQEAMPKLERLQIYQRYKMREISGLQFLTSLKEIRVDDDLKELVQRKLKEYPNNVTLKLI